GAHREMAGEEVLDADPGAQAEKESRLGGDRRRVLASQAPGRLEEDAHVVALEGIEAQPRADVEERVLAGSAGRERREQADVDARGDVVEDEIGGADPRLAAAGEEEGDSGGAARRGVAALGRRRRRDGGDQQQRDEVHGTSSIVLAPPKPIRKLSIMPSPAHPGRRSPTRDYRGDEEGTSARGVAVAAFRVIR